MNELFESLEINDEMKTQLSEAFDKAVMTKSVEMMDEHVETKVAERVETLEEEYAEKVENLEDTLDGYMTSVVEEFVAQNEQSFEAEIVDEKSKKLLEMFDAMLTVAGVTLTDIHEARSERDINEDANSLENQFDRTTEKLAEKEEALAESRREADKFLKAGIIAETAKGLSIVEADKFEKLSEMITFKRDEQYVTALETLKESIIDSRDEKFVSVDESIAKGVALPSAAYKSEVVDVKAATDFSLYV
jgi:hypothetical protein